MSRIGNIFGFFENSNKIDVKPPFDYGSNDYEVKKDNKLRVHLAYLKQIESEETNRLKIIEDKTAQLISQTGLIFSLLSLIIPLIGDKVLDFHIAVKIAFILLLAFTFLFYILTIHHALKNFNVRLFNYAKNSPTSVITHQGKSIESFVKMEIKDTLSIINNNTLLNNLKATNLISAFKTFRSGNFMTAILVIFVCTALLFTNSKPNEITLQTPSLNERSNIYIEQLKENTSILKELKQILEEDLTDRKNSKMETSEK